MVAIGHAQTTPEATKVCIETLASYHTGSRVFWISVAIVKVLNVMTSSQVLIDVFFPPKSSFCLEMQLTTRNVMM